MANSPGFYVCFRCGIVVLQAVKKLLAASLFGGLSITACSVAYHGNCLAVRSCQEISLSTQWRWPTTGLRLSGACRNDHYFLSSNECSFRPLSVDNQFLLFRTKRHYIINYANVVPFFKHRRTISRTAKMKQDKSKLWFFLALDNEKIFLVLKSCYFHNYRKLLIVCEGFQM